MLAMRHPIRYAKAMTRVHLALMLTLAGMLSVQAAPDAWKPILSQFCLDCHDADAAKGDLNLEALLDAPITANPDHWEQVIRQLQARQMPPIGKDRPDDPGYSTASQALIQVLDAYAESHPQPGRTSSLRRLNRTEYHHAIRDLLDLDIDVTALLPRDEASHGFDNITVDELSPLLLNRYISAAIAISRLAMGTGPQTPDLQTVRIQPDQTQEGPIDGLPFGTRGGALIRHTFPQDGMYEIQTNLARDRNEEVEGLRGTHQLDILLNQQHMKRFTIQRPKNNDHTMVDAELHTRIQVAAGPQELGVTFVASDPGLEETLRQPYQAHFNMHRHPRRNPAVFQVSITGPYDAQGVGTTPSRRRILGEDAGDESDAGAERIIMRLAGRAFRQGSEDGLKPMLQDRLMDFFRAEDTFEAGIEAALSAILVSREFLFRVESDPAGLAPGTPYAISDHELASRLSFFLWSSIPDDALLACDLTTPDILEQQTRRMLADPRAMSLVQNFAHQWLYLRNLDSARPDGRLFPDFDDNLRQAFRRETEWHVERMIHQDRSVLDLLKTRETFLNERLAKHYGIPHVYGERFRRVQLDASTQRGGLLRQGSLLTVTSYATRTSPVLRGHWVLKNLLGTPPPPPPPDVPDLEDHTISAELPMRERLAQHRANPACASCHDVMDPVGFALESFDATGRWRTTQNGQALDLTGGLPNGDTFTGVAGLEAALIKHPEAFVRTLTEK
ncbi:MAG: hypothetical protein ACI9QL_004199, partial [Candidatus Omnitrophota bacterium]